MKRAGLLVLVAIGGTALAGDSGLKAGLWEMTQSRQVMDGHDMSDQMAAAQKQMQQAMANMPEDQRKRMETMMNRQGMSGSSATGVGRRICISPQMAARDKPMIDPQGRCEPGKVTRSGNKASYEFNCSTAGRTMVGKGENTIGSDTVSTHIDMTVSDAQGSHTIQSDTAIKYLGADCQGVKPLDQLAKEAGTPPDSK